MKTKALLFVLLSLLWLGLPARAIMPSGPDSHQVIKEALALDYSMPDFTVMRIDENVIGTRLASLLEELNRNYKQQENIDRLSFLQRNQLIGRFFCSIKSMRLNKVEKVGNTITILYDTKLNPNSKGIKESQLSIAFIDGVSESGVVNDLFYDICSHHEQ